MNLSIVLDYWKYLAGLGGLVAALRGLWWVAVNVAVAPYERDQLIRQIRILESRIASLEQIVAAMEAESSRGFNASSSSGPVKTQTSTRRTRHSFSASIRSSNKRLGSLAAAAPLKTRTFPPHIGEPHDD